MGNNTGKAMPKLRAILIFMDQVREAKIEIRWGPKHEGSRMLRRVYPSFCAPGAKNHMIYAHDNKVVRLLI